MGCARRLEFTDNEITFENSYIFSQEEQGMNIKKMTAAALITLCLWFQQAEACSRVLWNDNKLAVFSACTMDWPESTEPILTVFPRGLQRNGGRVAGK